MFENPTLVLWSKKLCQTLRAKVEFTARINSTRFFRLIFNFEPPREIAREVRVSAYESISSLDTYLDLASREEARLSKIVLDRLRGQGPRHPTWGSYLCAVMNVSP